MRERPPEAGLQEQTLWKLRHKRLADLNIKTPRYKKTDKADDEIAAILFFRNRALAI